MKKPESGKRIAIVYRCISGLSGVPGIILNHAHYLSDLGHQVTLIGEDLDKARIAQTGAQIILIRRWPLPKLRRLQWFTRQADKQIRNFDFVVGHGHTMRQHVIHLHNCIRLAHEKIHGQPPRKQDIVMELQERMLMHAEFKFCIANSRLMQQELIRRYGLPQAKIQVVYPGSDLSRFKSADSVRYRHPVRQQLGIAEATVVIGLITSGDFQKRGVDIAINAFAGLPAAHRQRAVLLIIGKTSRLETYRQLVDARSLGGQIRFLPPIPQVERYYHALDLYIHPARFEEFGLSVQEAMACGLPVIASRQVGAMELLPQAAWDLLPLMLDAAELTRRMQALIEDEAMRRQWQEYCRQAVSKNSDSASFQHVLDVYHQAGL
jgi:UDP-glucose:(heptosyl)LPS alpha-1,3-glucosyltransferase